MVAIHTLLIYWQDTYARKHAHTHSCMHTRSHASTHRYTHSECVYSLYTTQIYVHYTQFSLPLLIFLPKSAF